MRLTTARLAILVVCASVPLAACAAGRVSAAPPGAEPAIRPILARMLRSAKALDTAGFMAPFLHAPTLVFAVNGTVIRGWKTLYAQQLKWWQHRKGQLHHSELGPIGFMAVAPGVEITALHLYARYALADGKAGGSALVVSYVWKHFPGGWQIIYGHESWVHPPD